MNQNEIFNGKQRVIQEFVPGKQITLAHIIANPNPGTHGGDRHYDHYAQRSRHHWRGRCDEGGGRGSGFCGPV